MDGHPHTKIIEKLTTAFLGLTEARSLFTELNRTLLEIAKDLRDLFIIYTCLQIPCGYICDEDHFGRKSRSLLVSKRQSQPK